MLSKLFKKKPVPDAHGEDDVVLNLTYCKIPQSLELKKRQEEELMRKNYALPKTKRAELL